MSRPDRSRRALVVALAAALPLSVHAAPATPYLQREVVQQWIDAVVERHGFERSQLERWLAAARYSESVERLMQPPVPFSQRNWLEYRARMLDERRIDAGATFWRANSAALARAHETYGIAPEIVVAVIGVETYYGRNTGDFRTLDVLATLSFDYPRRADFYRQELAEFLLLAREQRVDPLAYRGSFAGAIGLPQFMPGSVRRYAVDFDNDGRIDLAGSSADAIGSVASFLQQHGWQRHLPVLVEAEATEAIVDLLGRGINAAVSWYNAESVGVLTEAPLASDARVLVIDLPYIDVTGEVRRQYRVGTVNFSALLHYNRSYFYATAVVELAAAVRRAVGTG
jgi:membrane-bound lytic murein transglycosylase B